MPPVIAFGPRDLRDTFGQGRAIDAVAKLLHPPKKRPRAQELRKALDQTGAGVFGHRIGHRVNRLGSHQAVCIENQHRLPCAAPAGDPIGDIADLALGVFLTATIVQLGSRRQLIAQGHHAAQLGISHVEVLSVRQNKQRIAAPPLLRRKVFQNRARVAQNIGWIFVIDRHQQSYIQPTLRAHWLRRAFKREAQKPRQNRGERKADPEEVEADQPEQQAFGPADAAIGKPAVDDEPQGPRCPQRGAKGRQTPYPGRRPPADRLCRRIAMPRAEILTRHRHRVLGRHQRQGVDHAVHR